MIWLKTPKTLPTILNSIQSCPDGTRITLSGPKRSDEQNRRLHAMIRDVARQVKHHGMTLSEEDWKIIFCDALNRETRMVPNLSNNGLVALGHSTSNLSVHECADLITLITAFGDQHGVKFRADEILEASYEHVVR